MNKLFLMIIGLTLTTAYGQITDKEKDLKTQSKDTLDGWKIGGNASVTGSQTSLTNWVAGGQNSFAINGLLTVNADLKQGPNTWDNFFQFGYGVLKQSNRLFDPNGEKWIKTDDRILFSSKYGRKASEFWYYAGLVDFRTQATAGYAYPNDSIEISGFMAPAYILTAIGMDYKPSKKFSLFASPFTSKVTIVNDETLADAGAFGVQEAEIDPVTGLLIPGTGQRVRSEIGGYVRMQFKTGFGPVDENDKKHMFFTTRFDAFTNYLENPERIDISWETLLEVKLWKAISLTLSTHLIYDDDIDIAVVNDAGEQTAFSPRVQFKEVFGVGLAYNFGDQTD